MKIDLHCHTKKIKSGDGSLRNVTPELFKEKIELAEISIVAITNHNAFDHDQYVILKNIVNETCQVWPGIEIDVCEESKFHLIVVTKSEDADFFSSCVDMLFKGDDLDTCQHTMDEVYEAFKALDILYIPHFHDKRPAISEVDRCKLIELVGDSSRVFIEPRNHRTLGVIANKDLGVLIGSDVKDWNKYEECTFAELRLPIGSFSELLLLSKRDKNVVNTLLSKKQPLKINGKPHSTVDIQFKIYLDINIIFGQKGTGKTEILKSLYSEMISNGMNCKKYIAYERSDDFSALLNLKDMDPEIDKVHAIPCGKEFELLSKWTDRNPTQFSNYLEWNRTKGNSNNKNRMRITEAIHDNFIQNDKYDIHINDRNSMKTIITSLKKIDLQNYLSEDEVSQLLILIEKMQNEIVSNREADLILKLSSKMTNWSIDRLKSLADKNSDTISRPSTAGLKIFAQKRLELLYAIKTILFNLSVEEYNEPIRR